MKHKSILYKVYYMAPDGEFLAYLGRTKNNLTQRLRNHFVTHHKFQRKLEIGDYVRIEYAEFDTAADMFVAEIVLINQLKPPLNVDDKAQDELTIPIDLSHIKWQEWDKPHLLEKWKNEVEGR